MLRSLLLVALGGFVGSSLRFYTLEMSYVLFESINPWGTFFVNVVGSFIVGILVGLEENSSLLPNSLRLLLILGFCGGFTSFSAFSRDALLLFLNEEWFYLTLYMGCSVAMAVIFFWFGHLLTKIRLRPKSLHEDIDL